MMTDLEIRKVLNQIKDLKFGWNNNGARNFKPSFVDYVYEVIQKLKNPPDFIAPTGNDSIQLEYNYNDDSLYLEIEIDKENMELYKYRIEQIRNYLNTIDEEKCNVQNLINSTKTFIEKHFSNLAIEFDNEIINNPDA